MNLAVQIIIIVFVCVFALMPVVQLLQKPYNLGNQQQSKTNQEQDQEQKDDFCPWEVIYSIPCWDSANYYQTYSWDYRVEKLTGNVYIYHNRVIPDVYSIEVLSPLMNENGTPVDRAQLVELLASQDIRII